MSRKPLQALIIIDMQNDFVLPDGPACVAGAAATVPGSASCYPTFGCTSARCFTSFENTQPTAAMLMAFAKRILLRVKNSLSRVPLAEKSLNHYNPLPTNTGW